MNLLIEKYKKTFAGLAITAVVLSSLSPLFASKAEAQWVVFDPGNFVPNIAAQVKDYGLDAIAFTIVNLIIERMAASTVKWINSGFKGSPAFVTDPANYYKDIGDKAAGAYILTNPNLSFLCSDIQTKVRLALASTHNQTNRQWKCTVTDAIGNVEDFVNDFDKGGWDKFFKLSQTNNPTGAYLMAESDLHTKVANQAGQKEKELDWGQGFLSFKRCKVRGNVAATVAPTRRVCTAYAPLEAGNPKSGQCLNYADVPDDVSGQIAEDVCAGGEEIVTPGSVINDNLNEVLSVGGQKLAAADEINEIVSALLNQLINRVVGGIGNGLRGASKPETASGGSTFTDNLTNRNPGDAVVDYFGDAPNTDILDVPPTPESAGIDTTHLTDPKDVTGGGGSGGGSGGNNIMPTDTDCNGLAYADLSTMAQSVVDSSGGTISFNEAMLGLDCGPQGTH